MLSVIKVLFFEIYALVGNLRSGSFELSDLVLSDLVLHSVVVLDRPLCLDDSSDWLRFLERLGWQLTLNFILKMCYLSIWWAELVPKKILSEHLVS